MMINVCSSKLANKYNVDISSFDNWKAVIKQKTADKVRHLKSTKTPQQTKPILKDDNVIRYLSDFHKKYVIVSIDKAANNIAIICKQFYVMRLYSIHFFSGRVRQYTIYLEGVIHYRIYLPYPHR